MGVTRPDAPEGFVPTGFRIPVPFVERIGPTWMRRVENGADVGAWVSDSVRNGGPMAHGGFLMTLVDTATGHAANTVLTPDQYVLHMNISTDFYAPAPAGAWVEARARVERKGSSVVFCNCDLYVGEQKVGHATAIMKIVGARPPQKRTPE